MEQDDLLEKSWEFWKPIIYKNDGTLDIEAVKKELCDFYFMLEEVPKVYCHITGNKLSKPLYFAHTIISEADQYYEDLYSDEAKK